MHFTHIFDAKMFEKKNGAIMKINQNIKDHSNNKPKQAYPNHLVL